MLPLAGVGPEREATRIALRLGHAIVTSTVHTCSPNDLQPALLCIGQCSRRCIQFLNVLGLNSAVVLGAAPAVATTSSNTLPW